MALLLAFVTLNAWTFRHVWTMTHFSSGGLKTIRPEEMSLLGKSRVLLAGVNVPRPENGRTPSDVGLEFATERVIASDGVDLELWHVPAARPRAVVLLFHGYSTSKASVLGEARAFHDLGCAVVPVDFRGSGGSAGNRTTLGMFEGLDVAAACEFAERRYPDLPKVLFGRSMGSVAILRAVAHENVRPAGVILECPFDRLLTTVEHRFSAMGLPSFPMAEMMVFWGGLQHGMNGFEHNPVEYARLVDCPALQMHGSRDKRVSVAEAQAVFDALAGEKRLEVFPEVGHEACHVTRPELWAGLVEEFLARVTRSK